MPGKADLKPGLLHSQSITVTRELTVPEISPLYTGLADLPPVFATAQLLAFVEWTCLEAVRPCLEPGERTVGTAVTLSHTAAMPVGMRVTADVELTAVTGRMLAFSFTCCDEAGHIGEGTHGRAIIDAERFMAKVAQRRG